MSEKHQVKCKANGCHDRYNCQLYDTSADPIGTTHIIPLDHKPGEEQCFMYIPKDNLPKDERERLLLIDFYSDNDESSEGVYTYCPGCGRTLDDADFDFQICHFCGWSKDDEV